MDKNPFIQRDISRRNSLRSGVSNDQAPAAVVAGLDLAQRRASQQLSFAAEAEAQTAAKKQTTEAAAATAAPVAETYADDVAEAQARKQLEAEAPEQASAPPLPRPSCRRRHARRPR